MKYQLVLQFPSDSFEDDSAAAAFEEELIPVLGESAYVDGIDLGPSTTSIFIFTDDPGVTFHRATPLLTRKELLDSVTAAHRLADGERYSIIWPENDRSQFRLA